MTERDRLIELLKEADEEASNKCITDYNEAISDNADYLLANGVMLVDTNTVNLVTNREPIQTAFGMPLDELADLIRAKQEGRIIVLPWTVGQLVYVDVDTLPRNYLHPLEIDGKYAKCQVITMVIGKTQTYIKMAAFYPSRYGKRDYLKYPISAIGKTVFLTREEAERAITERRGE